MVDDLKVKIITIDDNLDILEDYKKILSNQYTNQEKDLDELEEKLLGRPRKEVVKNQQTFEIVSASQGEEGYKKIAQAVKDKDPFALAFVDIRMPPGWDGIQTVKKICEIDPDIEIVFCSAHSDFELEDMHQFIHLKNDFIVISKPFEAIEIKQAAISLCHKWQYKKELNQKYHVVQKQLMQADKMASIGQLAAGVAHEINNPVGFINSNISTLKSYIDELLKLIDYYEPLEHKSSDAQDLVDTIHNYKKSIDLNYIKEDIVDLIRESSDGVSRVKQIIKDLKDFSHQGEKKFEAYDLHDGLNTTLNIVSNELKYKAELVKKYGDVNQIDAVGPQINQVILNLLVNASHAIEDKGTITIETGQDNDNIWFKISDDGKGIPEENMQNIFDPFFTTKEVGKGTGLGLSLSYGILQAHNGDISVASEVGVGTTFTVTIPKKQDNDSNLSVSAP